MKRMHVHVGVENLDSSISFYSALFATKPVVLKSDYAKWMLDDPRVNFAISTRGKQPGRNHLGIQVESQEELHEVYGRLRNAGGEAQYIRISKRLSMHWPLLLRLVHSYPF
jgi:hypothetical protein